MDNSEVREKTRVAELVLPGNGLHLSATVSVPQGPMQLTELLPIARSISEALVAESIKSAEESGQKISCRKGCGACCRQLVAISLVEAQELDRVVAAMAPERQSVIRARFDAAVRRLDQAGLIDRNVPLGDRALIARNRGSRAATLQEISHRYFKLQIPCPFLEEESCSIYADRPLVCREYHVTSPAERCAKLFEQPIDRVEVPIHLGDVVSSAAEKLSGSSAYSVPLVLALEWSEKHRESFQRLYDGEQIAQAMLDEIREGWKKSLAQPSGSQLTSSTTIDYEGSPAPLSVVRLIDAGDNQEKQAAQVELYGSKWLLETAVSVPKSPTAISELLPIAQRVADSVVDATVKSIQESGQEISCRKGCGACCRQLVPISGVEARRMRDLVDDLPEPRRSEIRGRFAAARRRLEESGLLKTLITRTDWKDSEVGALGLKYFAQGIPCPFLEEESCSIYADRPIVCREYLVTSPAENCARPSAQTIDQVSLPFKIWPALARLEKNSPSARFIPWVPLILAVDGADTVPMEPAKRSGIELLRELVAFVPANRFAGIERAPATLSESAASKITSIEKNPALFSKVAASSGPSPVRKEIGADLTDLNFPLRIGSAVDFARVRELFRITRFNESTICRIFKINDMSDIGSVNRQTVQISGMLGLFIRLFLFIDTVPRAEIESLLDHDELESLLALDLIRLGTFQLDNQAGSEKFYCPVWLYPVEDFVIASDRGKNPDGSARVRMPDIVFPAIYEGTLRFLRVISKSPAEDALDLCSGSGIAALVLSRNAKRVVACDITSRAGHFARFNCLLNGCTNVEAAQGDLYGAVDNQMFDRIVAHPPFVPSSSEGLIYRDSGNTGEALIKRIIEGLPHCLRPGGTFYMVCSAWDSNEKLFEERVRSWLGERKGEFDIIFALDKASSPEQIARQLPEIKESGDPSAIIRWTSHFREVGFKTNVYGGIVIHRQNLKNNEGRISGPITRRLRLGELTDGTCFEWALRWFHWRARKEAAGELIDVIAQMRPRLGNSLKVKVTHKVRDGSLIIEETVLETQKPFPAASRVDSWMAQMFAQFNGERTTQEVYENAEQSIAIPESFKFENFATLVTSMLERGHLELDDSTLES